MYTKYDQVLQLFIQYFNSFIAFFNRADFKFTTGHNFIHIYILLHQVIKDLDY